MGMITDNHQTGKFNGICHRVWQHIRVLVQCLSTNRHIIALRSGYRLSIYGLHACVCMCE